METGWKKIIIADNKAMNLNVKELWKYRDLCLIFLKKNYITQYKQTIFGPVYMMISPLVTSGIYTLLFGLIANISTEGAPQILFYMVGNMIWSYFAGCVYCNMNVFHDNAYIMGKVYFPRLIIPISNILTQSVRLIVEIIMLGVVGLIVSYLYADGLNPNMLMLLIPFVLLQMAMFGFGLGILITSLNVKYKDVSVIAGFGMKIWLYLSPVIYPVSTLKGVLRTLIMFNPLTPGLEITRAAIFGNGTVSVFHWGISIIVTLITFVMGLYMFDKVERNFVDTI